MIHVFWKKLYMLYGAEWFLTPDTYTSPHRMEYWDVGTSIISARISNMTRNEYIEYNDRRIKFTQKFINEIEKE